MNRRMLDEREKQIAAVGGYVFPSGHPIQFYDDGTSKASTPGMTLLDHFAAAALQSIPYSDFPDPKLVEKSWQLARMMLEARPAAIAQAIADFTGYQVWVEIPDADPNRPPKNCEVPKTP